MTTMTMTTMNMNTMITMTMTTTYLSATKTIDLARHHNLPTLMDDSQASYTHNLFFNIFRKFIIEIVLNILVFQMHFG